jgi:hypothetical protein
VDEGTGWKDYKKRPYLAARYVLSSPLFDPFSSLVLYRLNYLASTCIMPFFVSFIAAGTALLGQLAVAGAAPSSSSSGPTANTLNGTYYGYHNSFYNEDFFLGMPYAQPPVNNLRYEPPQALNSSWTGFKNATQYGYECVGYGVCS